MNDGSDDRTDLDGELRRLFADDRLTLPVAQGADQVVVAGAHRRRRRRLTVAAAGGVIAVVAVVTMSLGLSGVVRGTDRTVSAASKPPSVTLTTTSSAAPAPADWRVIGPFGVGSLRLGMSMSEVAKAAGIGRPTMTTQDGSCKSLTAIEYATFGEAGRLPVTGSTMVAPTEAPSSSPPVGSGAAPGAVQASGASAMKVIPFRIELTVSPNGGIVRIGGSELLHTPEGIGIGAQYTDVEKVYPNSARPQVVKSLVLETAVPGNPAAIYVFDCDGYGTVMDIWLEEAKPNC